MLPAACYPWLQAWVGLFQFPPQPNSSCGGGYQPQPMRINNSYEILGGDGVVPECIPFSCSRQDPISKWNDLEFFWLLKIACSVPVRSDAEGI